MATTTRTVLRQRLSELLSDYWSSTASGNGSTTTLVDTTLAGLADNDDSFPNWYVMPISGTSANIGVVRRVKLTGGYTASSTTLTVSRAWPSATATSDGYELSRIDPTLKHNALNRSAEELYPHIYLPVRDETLVVDNLLLNSDFETISAGDATSWTRVNAPTLTAETTIIMHSGSNGTQSAKIVAGGSAGRMFQAVSPLVINAAVGKTLRFKCWVYATVASTARIGISLDGGTTFTYSTYHTGGSDWEYLSVSLAVTSTATSVRAYLEVAANGTAYFDACYAAVRPLYRYTIPTTFLGRLNFVDMQDDELNPNGNYYAPDGFIEGRRLRLRGMGALTLPTTESGTMEIGNKQVQLLTAWAASWLHASIGSIPASTLRDVYGNEANSWRDRAERLLADKSARMRPLGADDRGAFSSVEGRTWHIESDGTTDYLVLDDWRG